MKERQNLNALIRWDEQNVFIIKDGQELSLNVNETVGMTIILQEILKEWRETKQS
ncbi:MAG: hypothetical protein KAX49_09595 [Halanaerobiales bacterium]|nr:hypothetical protein [Halanaerobiales bacterium]